MNKTIASLSAAILVALGSSAQAASPEVNDGLRAQVAKSDLVFVGTVADVAYAPSLVAGDGRGIPHTFVTYEVERVLQGQADSEKITLRFIGGRGEESAFLAVSGQPMFDLGDRDVLMVAGNGTSGCPLVDCADGRYRLIRDMVFSEEGRAIENTADGELARTTFYDLEEVMTHRVSQTTFHLVDRLEPGESRESFDGASRGAHMDEAQLVERIETTARTLGKATPGTFRSADIRAPIMIGLNAEAAPADKARDSSKRTSDATAQDLAEEAALRENGGDPVIDISKEQRQDGA
jgi:hypothetical protein